MHRIVFYCCILICLIFWSCKSYQINSEFNGINDKISRGNQFTRKHLNIDSIIKSNKIAIGQIKMNESIHSCNVLTQKKVKVRWCFSPTDSVKPKIEHRLHNDNSIVIPEQPGTQLSKFLEKTGLGLLLLGIGFPLFGWYVNSMNQTLLVVFPMIGLVLIVLGGILLTIRGFMK